MKRKSKFLIYFTFFSKYFKNKRQKEERKTELIAALTLRLYQTARMLSLGALKQAHLGENEEEMVL